MKPPTIRDAHQDPQRWTAAKPQDVPPAVSVGLQGLRTRTEDVSAARLQRMRVAINEKIRPAASRPARRLGFAVTVAVVLFGAGVASAVMLARQLGGSKREANSLVQEANAPEAQQRRRPRRTAPVLPPPPASLPSAEPLTESPPPANAPSPAPLPERATGNAHPPAVARTRHPLPAPREPLEAPPATDTVLPEAREDDPRSAAEVRLLTRVLAALRSERDPRAALSLLNEYQAQFPSGAFRSEATLARTEAHLALGQLNEALLILEPLPLHEMPRPRRLRLLRADLRASAGRCEEALEDFAAAFAGRRDELAERALRGRATCRARLGDVPGAREDLRQHLELFPDHPQGRTLQERLGPP